MHRLTTLGTLSIATSDGAQTALAPRRRALALLALAAASAKEGVSRDRVLALLWPELDAAKARNNLKQTVFAIRQALGSEVFDPAATNFCLDTRSVVVDLHQYEHALAAGAHDEALALYAGPFLDGFFVPNLREFDRWVERVRARLGWGHAQGLEALAVKARLRGDVSSGIHWYRLLVEHDPLSTAYALGLISTLADAGEPLEALEFFRAHSKLVREEFDTEPDRKVQLAAERVRQGLAYRASGGADSSLAGAGAAPPPPGEPRVVRRISGPVPMSPMPPRRPGTGR